MDTSVTRHRTRRACRVIATACAVLAIGSNVAEATADPPDAELPRSVDYAGLTWTVQSVEVSTGAASDQTIRLGLNVTSHLESLTVYVPASIVGVSLADGTLVRARMFDDTDSPGTIVIDPGASIDAVAVVEPDAGIEPVTTDALSFVIDESDLTPAVLPLSGPALPNPYPVVADLAATTGPIPGSCPTANTVEIALRRAVVALDLESRRAPIDTEFVTFDLDITAIDGFYDQACVSGPFFRLTVDGTVVEPVGGTTFSASIALGTTLERSVSFSVPIGSRTFELGVGADGATVASIPVVLDAPSADSTTPAGEKQS